MFLKAIYTKYLSLSGRTYVTNANLLIILSNYFDYMPIRPIYWKRPLVQFMLITFLSFFPSLFPLFLQFSYLSFFIYLIVLGFQHSCLLGLSYIVVFLYFFYSNLIFDPFGSRFRFISISSFIFYFFLFLFLFPNALPPFLYFSFFQIVYPVCNCSFFHIHVSFSLFYFIPASLFSDILRTSKTQKPSYLFLIFQLLSLFQIFLSNLFSIVFGPRIYDVEKPDHA